MTGILLRSSVPGMVRSQRRRRSSRPDRRRAFPDRRKQQAENGLQPERPRIAFLMASHITLRLDFRRRDSTTFTIKSLNANLDHYFAVETLNEDGIINNDKTVRAKQ